MRVKIRDEGLVKNKAVYVALAYNGDGEKDLLGLWIDQTEGAKFWLRVVNELKTRGVNDILIAVVDGPEGLPRSDQFGLPPDAGANLHRAPDPQQPCLRVLEGPQGNPAFEQGDLSGRERRRGAGAACRVRGRVGQALPRDRPDLAQCVGVAPFFVVSITTSSLDRRLLPIPSRAVQVMSTRPACRRMPSSQITTSPRVRGTSIPNTRRICASPLPLVVAGAAGRHNNYGFALTAQPGESQSPASY